MMLTATCRNNFRVFAGSPCRCLFFFLFFFNAPPPPDIYTLSLHDALPISEPHARRADRDALPAVAELCRPGRGPRSEEHTSELQSRLHLVCRLLLEKKNTH